MLLELREDRFEAAGYTAVISNDFDAIDEQEEQARTEVRLTGELFAFPTSEVFYNKVGYSPPTPPYRTPKGEHVPPHRGDTRGDSHFKKTEPKPEAPPARQGPTATEVAEKKRGEEERRADAEHRRERLYNERKKAKTDAKRSAKVRRWMQEDVLERKPALRPATVKLPVYCGNEPSARPIYRKGDYANHKVDPGSEFTVLWPGHPINRRVFVCKERAMIIFSGGNLKEAVVFDLDGREMRIEADACWDTFVFNILGEPKP